MVIILQASPTLSGFPRMFQVQTCGLMKKMRGLFPISALIFKKSFNHAALGAGTDSIPFIWNRAGAIRWLTCSVYIFVTQHAITYFIALVGFGHSDSIQRHFGERERGQIYSNISHLTVEDHLFPVSLYRDPCTAPISNTAFQYTWKQEFNQDSEYTICTVCVCACAYMISCRLSGPPRVSSFPFAIIVWIRSKSWEEVDRWSWQGTQLMWWAFQNFFQSENH